MSIGGCLEKLLYNSVLVSYDLSDHCLEIDIKDFCGKSCLGFLEDEKLKIIDEFTEYVCEHEEKIRGIKKLIFRSFSEFMINSTSKLFKFVHYIAIEIEATGPFAEDEECDDFMNVVNIPQCKKLRLAFRIFECRHRFEKILHLLEIIPVSVEELVIDPMNLADSLLMLKFFNMPPSVKIIVIENYIVHATDDTREATKKQIIDSFRKNGLDESCKIIFDDP